MAELSNIIVVNITKQTTPLSRASFSNILIVGPNPTFVNRIQFFSATASGLTALAAVLTGGTGDPEYIAASAIVAQSPRVTQFAVGREDGGDATITVTLDAIVAESNDWYGLVIVDRTVAVQKLAGDFALANKKLFACASAGTDIGGGIIDIIDQADGVDATSIAFLFKSGSNERAIAFYKADAATKFTDAALLGKILPLEAGTYTAAFKTLLGETIDVLTDTQAKNVKDKNANTYEEVASRSIVQNGTTGTGEFADVIVFEDTLVNDIQTNQFILLANTPKVSYDDSGINTVNSTLINTLKGHQSEEGRPRGITADSFDPLTKDRTGGFSTTVPLASSVPTVDKANRELNNVEFTAFLSGAIHKEVINGILTL